MPWSEPEGKDVIGGWLHPNKDSIQRVLDIGVGSGTYHNEFGQADKLLSHAKWIGIEVWEPYIDRFNLNEKYDVIINHDARSLDYSKLDRFDVVFLGDVLEHMTKDEAIALIDKVSQVSNRVIISIPIIHLPQGEAEGNPYEVHVKDDWTHEEVMQTFKVDKFSTGRVVGVYLLKEGEPK